MNNTTNNTNNNSPINKRLNYSNYHNWTQMMIPFLQQKVLFHHIEYSSYDNYRDNTYVPASIKEKKYFKAKAIILSQEIKVDYTEDDRDDKLEALEETFKDSFKSFESDRQKQIDKWTSEEQQIYGIFAGSIEEYIWQDCKCLRSAHSIWEHIRRATGQQTASAWLSSLSDFYNATWKEGETLSNFVGRVLKSHNTILELGVKDFIFTPIQIVGKIISSIPNSNKFQQLLQAIHQMDRSKLTIDFIKQVFIEEDMRTSKDKNLINNKRQEAHNANINNNKLKNKQSKPNSKEVRTCTSANCKNTIAADAPSSYVICSSCHSKKKDNNNNSNKIIPKNINNNKNKEKASNVVLCLSTSHKKGVTPKEDTMYLDSAATKHITNGNAILLNIIDDNTNVSGPSGEIVEATNKADILFNTGLGQILFRDALVVPEMERNLLSIKDIAASADDIFIIFNKTGCQIIKGNIIIDGKTFLQAHLDDSGLYALSPHIIDDSAKDSESAEAERTNLPVINNINNDNISRKEHNNNILWNSKRKNFLDNNNNISSSNNNTTNNNIINESPNILEATSADLRHMDILDDTLSLNIMLENILGIKKESEQEEKKVENSLSPLLHSLLFPTLPSGDREPMPKFLEKVCALKTLLKKLPSKTLEEWHLTLAHISKKKILKLAEMGMIKVKNPSDSLDCLSCKSAKMKRKNFEKAMPPKADKSGEVLYSDVCGKISPPTLFGEKYVVTFIDEKSGYIFAYLLKKKNEVYSRFCEVLARVNNQNINTSVKMFVSDGGGEYIGSDFQNFLKEKGIVHCKTPPNTPQRNGKSERLNKIIFDLARAMLKERQLPRHFWGEAVLYAVYILNRLPKNNNDETRHQMLLGKKPTLEKTLEFGLPVYFHNADPHIKKLHDRSFEGMFLGFWEDDHTYKILDFKTKKLISTRTISSHPQHILQFEDNDWDQGFPVEDDNQWISEKSDAPQYFRFNDLDNFLKKSDIEIQESEEISEEERDQEVDESEEEDVDNSDESEEERNEPEPPPPFNILISLKDQQPKVSNVKHLVLSVREVENVLSLSETDTPNTYKQAIYGKFSKEWKESIAAEHKSLQDLKTFEVVDRPIDKKPITSRYVFKIKTDEKGAISKFKTRLVARGFTQTYGQDYFEVFSPTLRMDSIRFLISTAVQNQMKIQHLDVETAFLNGVLAEEIYLEIPEGFDEYDRKSKVFKLKKSIYGLKQASRVWNELFTSELLKMGLIQSDADPCVFIKYQDSSQPATTTTSTSTTPRVPIGMIGVFVDDCLAVGGDDVLAEIKSKLMSIFKMHDLGPLTFALGIKFDQLKDNSIQMSQALYVDKLLEKFGMMDAKIVATPLVLKNAEKPKNEENEEKSPALEDINKYQSIVGSLIYLEHSTRPDIAYAVSLLARSMHAPTEEDMKNAKRVLRYLKGTRDLVLNYNNKNEELVIYSDSSYAEEKDRKSVGGYVSLQAGAAITWKSTKQSIIAQSSMEAEYIALAEAAKEAEWLRKLQQEFRPTSLTTPTTIFEDNQSTIKLSKNPIHSNRSKHIAVRYHKIQELVANKIIAVEYKPTEEMIADIMTKSLGRILHERFVKMMGLTKVKHQ